MSDTAEGITSQRVIELERADAVRQALERAANHLETRTGDSEPYRKALKLAARLIRDLKP